MEAKEYVELLEQFCATDLNYQINDNTIRVFEDNTLFYDYDIDKHQILLNERNNQSELGLWADEKMSNVHFALLIKSSIERLYNENAFNNYDGFHSLDELRDVIETSFEESSYAIGKKEEGKLSIVEDPSGSFLIEFYLDGSGYLIEETGEKSFAFLRFYNELLYLENKHKQLKEYQSVFKTTFSEAEILSIIGYDKYRCTELKNEIVSSLEINDMMLKTALNGAKVPHSTSQPVIYKRGTDYHIATFTFLYTRDDINKGAVDRPTVWTMADLRTGEIIEEFQTKEVDFSNASYDKKYMIRSNNEYNTSNEYYEKAFSILDNVRKKIIYNDTFDKEAYANYMEMILANIPEEYKRFYKDLSVDYVNEEDDENGLYLLSDSTSKDDRTKCGFSVTPEGEYRLCIEELLTEIRNRIKQRIVQETGRKTAKKPE